MSGGMTFEERRAAVMRRARPDRYRRSLWAAGGAELGEFVCCWTSWRCGSSGAGARCWLRRSTGVRPVRAGRVRRRGCWTTARGCGLVGRRGWCGWPRPLPTTGMPRCRPRCARHGCRWSPQRWWWTSSTGSRRAWLTVRRARCWPGWSTSRRGAGRRTSGGSGSGWSRSTGRSVSSRPSRTGWLSCGRLSQPFADGGGLFEYTMVVDAEAKAVIEAAVQGLSAPRPANGEPDRRPSGQRRLDALLEVVRRGVASADGVATTPKAELYVTVALDDLVARTNAATVFGSGEAGTLLAPETARRIACDAGIIPVVLGKDGQVLDLGRRFRHFTSAQARALWLRDGGCTFPDCTVPAAWCDGHHLWHWADGGPTNLENAALLCGRHHTLVHKRATTAARRRADRPGTSPSAPTTTGSPSGRQRPATHSRWVSRPRCVSTTCGTSSRLPPKKQRPHRGDHDPAPQPAHPAGHRHGLLPPPFRRVCSEPRPGRRPSVPGCPSRVRWWLARRGAPARRHHGHRPVPRAARRLPRAGRWC